MARSDGQRLSTQRFGSYTLGLSRSEGGHAPIIGLGNPKAVLSFFFVFAVFFLAVPSFVRFRFFGLWSSMGCGRRWAAALQAMCEADAQLEALRAQVLTAQSEAARLEQHVEAKRHELRRLDVSVLGAQQRQLDVGVGEVSSGHGRTNTERADEAVAEMATGEMQSQVRMWIAKQKQIDSLNGEGTHTCTHAHMRSHKRIEEVPSTLRSPTAERAAAAGLGDRVT